MVSGSLEAYPLPPYALSTVFWILQSEQAESVNAQRGAISPLPCPASCSDLGVGSLPAVSHALPCILLRILLQRHQSLCSVIFVNSETIAPAQDVRVSFAKLLLLPVGEVLAFTLAAGLGGPRHVHRWLRHAGCCRRTERRLPCRPSEQGAMLLNRRVGLFAGGCASARVGGGDTAAALNLWLLVDPALFHCSTPTFSERYFSGGECGLPALQSLQPLASPHGAGQQL